MLIRPPRLPEWPACRMLLPDAFHRGGTPEVLLAVEADSPQLLGGAAYYVRGEQAGLLQLRVVRTHRRKGVGSGLLREFFSHSLAEGVQEVTAFVDVHSNPDASPFLAAHGFERKGRMFVVETDLDSMLAGMTRLRDRLLAGGKVPAGARLVSPSQAPMDEVARLYNENIIQGRCLRPEFLRDSLLDPKFEKSSIILMVGEQVAGLLMVEHQIEVHRALVPARVVVEEYRGGWVNVLMMAKALELGAEAGIRRVRFESLENNSDTLKLAQRYQAETVHVLDRFLRLVSPADRRAE